MGLAVSGHRSACLAHFGKTPDKAVLLSTLAPSLKRCATLIDGMCASTMLGRLVADVRLLADYVVFLRDTERPRDLVDIWALSLAVCGGWVGTPEERALLLACADTVRRLAGSWKAYENSYEGLGNFDNTKEWEQHGFPDGEIIEKVTKRAHPDDEKYCFSIAAMVGMHTAIVCSSIVASEARAASGGGATAAMQVAFNTRFPTLSYDECRQRQNLSVDVPRKGSAYSPKTCLAADFRLEAMSPLLFQEVRRALGISDGEFFESVCRTDFDYIAFGTNSASREFFFFSHDRKFLIKTTTPVEADTLVSMLPDYVPRLRREPRTLLGKYAGLFRLHSGPTAKLFFVMQAVSLHGLKVTKTYDLKGSTRHRRAKPAEPCGKDVNFREEMGGTLRLPADIAGQLAEVHRADTELLLKYRIMDFSLLLQIHDTTGAADGPEPRGVRLRQVPTAAKSLWHKGGRMAVPALGSEGASFSMVAALAKLTGSAGWDPSHTGLTSADGKLVYTLGIIDCLVPYDFYESAQYVGTELITCGRGLTASRVPPEHYTARQRAMVEGMTRPS